VRLRSSRFPILPGVKTLDWLFSGERCTVGLPLFHTASVISE
jgi:hypothetical protein